MCQLHPQAAEKCGVGGRGVELPPEEVVMHLAGRNGAEPLTQSHPNVPAVSGKWGHCL
jgi:hypothetical protein